MPVAGLERMTTGSVPSALSYRATQVDRYMDVKYNTFHIIKAFFLMDSICQISLCVGYQCTS